MATMTTLPTLNYPYLPEQVYFKIQLQRGEFSNAKFFVGGGGGNLELTKLPL